MKRIFIVITLFFVLTQGIFAQTTAGQWLERTREYLIAGDYNNAISAASEAINRGSTNLDAYWWRGNAYLYTDNYDASIADFNIVINGAPNFANVFMQRGFVYGAMGMYNRAIADYRTGLEKGYIPTGGGWRVTGSPNETSSMWLLGLLHMEIVINRFLGNNDAVTRYDNFLRTLCTDTNVPRADVEAFYRNGIRELISSTVNEEFNRISFSMSNDSIRKGYNVVLTRSTNNHYILYYEGIYQGQPFQGQLTAQTLEALLAEMSRRNDDFDQTCINTVRTQAGLIPAVVDASSVNRATQILVAFYTNPSGATFADVWELYARYPYDFGNSRDAGLLAARSLYNSVISLNPELGPILIDPSILTR